VKLSGVWTLVSLSSLLVVSLSLAAPTSQRDVDGKDAAAAAEAAAPPLVRSMYSHSDTQTQSTGFACAVDRLQFAVSNLICSFSHQADNFEE